jgi:hypothetical protein
MTQIAITVLLWWAAGCTKNIQPMPLFDFDFWPPTTEKIKAGYIKCPCDGMRDCRCDTETGEYSFFYGCNTTTCYPAGYCGTTMAICNWGNQ